MAKRTMSESAAWEAVQGYAEQALRTPHVSRTDLYGIIDIAKRMQDQLAHGVHVNPRYAENPALVVWPNPGRRTNPLPGTTLRADDPLSKRVYEIAYKHVEDGKDYKHDFGPGVEMWLAHTGQQQVVVIFGTRGQDVFADF